MGKRGPRPGSEGARRISKASKAALADPAVRAKMDWLSPGQISEIVERIRTTKDRYPDIAMDWLVSEGTICRIARAAGVERRPRLSGRRFSAGEATP
jgi:hypothetical protein